eukprot:727775-Amorphochlora_amoeboformis.AAC.1
MADGCSPWVGHSGTTMAEPSVDVLIQATQSLEKNGNGNGTKRNRSLHDFPDIESERRRRKQMEAKKEKIRKREVESTAHSGKINGKGISNNHNGELFRGKRLNGHSNGHEKPLLNGHGHSKVSGHGARKYKSHGQGSPEDHMNGFSKAAQLIEEEEEEAEEYDKSRDMRERGKYHRGFPLEKVTSEYAKYHAKNGRNGHRNLFKKHNGFHEKPSISGSAKTSTKGSTNGANGHRANGHGVNGHGVNGHGVNGNGTNGHGAHGSGHNGISNGVSNGSHGKHGQHFVPNYDFERLKQIVRDAPGGRDLRGSAGGEVKANGGLNGDSKHRRSQHLFPLSDDSSGNSSMDTNGSYAARGFNSGGSGSGSGGSGSGSGGSGSGSGDGYRSTPGNDSGSGSGFNSGSGTVPGNSSGTTAAMNQSPYDSQTTPPDSSSGSNGEGKVTTKQHLSNNSQRWTLRNLHLLMKYFGHLPPKLDDPCLMHFLATTSATNAIGKTERCCSCTARLDLSKFILNDNR